MVDLLEKRKCPGVFEQIGAHAVYALLVYYRRIQTLAAAFDKLSAGVLFFPAGELVRIEGLPSR